MIRARFITDSEDPRPVNWPIKHPFWITGHDGDRHTTIVAYAEDEAEILANWPEARQIDATEASAYIFTSRFKKPDWLTIDT